MKQGQALNIFAAAAIVLTAAGSWHFREPLGQTLGKSIVEQTLKSLPGRDGQVPGVAGSGDAPGPGGEAAAAKTTVYRWVDAEGVTHYDQQGGAGREEISLDSGNIQRLEDLAPAQAQQ